MQRVMEAYNRALVTVTFLIVPFYYKLEKGMETYSIALVTGDLSFVRCVTVSLFSDRFLLIIALGAILL